MFQNKPTIVCRSAHMASLRAESAAWFVILYLTCQPNFLYEIHFGITDSARTALSVMYPCGTYPRLGPMSQSNIRHRRLLATERIEVRWWYNEHADNHHLSIQMTVTSKLHRIALAVTLIHSALLLQSQWIRFWVPPWLFKPCQISELSNPLTTA